MIVNDEELNAGLSFNQYDYLHNVDGPAVELDKNRNAALFSNDEIFWIDGKCYPTVQDWGNALVEKGYKTKSEAALLVLRWS